MTPDKVVALAAEYNRCVRERKSAHMQWHRASGAFQDAQDEEKCALYRLMDALGVDYDT